VVGLADLDKAANAGDGIGYDDCYQKNRHNYFDIVLTGDAVATRPDALTRAGAAQNCGFPPRHEIPPIRP
jgi:hypothetical protein